MILISYEGESTAENETETVGFNHNDRAFTTLKDGQRYDITVYDDWSYYECVGLIAGNSDREHKLIPTGDTIEEVTETEANGTGTPTMDERLDIRLDALERELEGLRVTMESSEPITESIKKKVLQCAQ